MNYTTLITVEELAPYLSNPDCRIIDCRFTLADVNKGRMDYQASHIPGAFYAHLDEELSGEIIPDVTGRHPLPPVAAFSDQLASWGIDASVQVVAYDYGNGAIASRLWWMLNWLGHERVAVLDGGWPAWQATGQPVSADLPTISPRPFVASPRMDRLCDAATVEQRRQQADYCLIDARASRRYAGIEEPIDPVAGHIPGAVNLPFAENVEERGKWRSSAELHQRFAQQLAGRPAGQAIVYCGSGVTACHNLLAMKHAGLGEGQLYAGSWSDWITDPNRPVEKN
ncbi:MAG: sulfurtransferase [Bacteroidota bacterium]